MLSQRRNRLPVKFMYFAALMAAIRRIQSIASWGLLRKVHGICPDCEVRMPAGNSLIRKCPLVKSQTVKSRSEQRLKPGLAGMGPRELARSNSFRVALDSGAVDSATRPKWRLFGHVARIPLSMSELAIYHSLAKLIFGFASDTSAFMRI